jgi:hypothetical protein
MDFGRLASITGMAARSTTRTTDGHTVSRLNAPRPIAIVARICVGMPLFGETEALQWVSQLSSLGRC